MHEFELLSHWAHRQPSDPAPVKTFSRNMHLTSFVPVVRGHQLRNNLPRRPTRAQRARATPARVVQVSADTEQETAPWEFGRFVKTVMTFQPPPTPDQVVQGLMERAFGKPEPKSALVPLKGAEGVDAKAGIVMVVGATGGVGKRVVERLLARGRHVRALVRDVTKARKMLGAMDGTGILELAPADITQPATLLPEFFQGVRQLVHCAAVTVGPKEGDTQDRSKYMQGVKFYDPTIVGATPEMVEYQGMRNVVRMAAAALGVEGGKVLFGVENGEVIGAGAWAALDDVVMGGKSLSYFVLDPKGGEAGEPCGVFKGNVTTANRGGFASVRTKNYQPALDLSMYDGIQLRVKGNGLRFKFILRSDANWDTTAYTHSFDTTDGVWETISIPFTAFTPVFRAKTLRNSSLDASSIFSLQLMLSKFEYDEMLNPSFTPGNFELPVAAIRTYMVPDDLRPRMVHVSSAGVTRCDRPGIDLEQEPPAVRMNEELGGIMTFKLRAEDVLRDSGVPYTIVRPVALTEEPGGAPLEFDQSDNIKGKISRDDVADICLAALDEAAALDVTFEVKSTVPFSTPWTGTELVEHDFARIFSSLSKGVTGKTDEHSS